MPNNKGFELQVKSKFPAGFQRNKKPSGSIVGYYAAEHPIATRPTGSPKKIKTALVR